MTLSRHNPVFHPSPSYVFSIVLVPGKTKMSNQRQGRRAAALAAPQNEEENGEFSFIKLCEDFQREFDRLLPHETRNRHGRYEHAINYAFRRIEELTHVESRNMFPKATDVFLVSDENEMAVYKRIVRENSKFYI